MHFRTIVTSFAIGCAIIGLAQSAFGLGGGTGYTACRMWLTRQKPNNPPNAPWTVTAAGCLGACPTSGGQPGSCVEATLTTYIINPGNHVIDEKTCGCLYPNQQYPIVVSFMQNGKRKAYCDGRKNYVDGVPDWGGTGCLLECPTGSGSCIEEIIDNFNNSPPGFTTQYYICECH